MTGSAGGSGNRSGSRSGSRSRSRSTGGSGIRERRDPTPAELERAVEIKDDIRSRIARGDHLSKVAHDLDLPIRAVEVAFVAPPVDPSPEKRARRSETPDDDSDEDLTDPDELAELKALRKQLKAGDTADMLREDLEGRREDRKEKRRRDRLENDLLEAKVERVRAGKAESDGGVLTKTDIVDIVEETVKKLNGDGGGSKYDKLLEELRDQNRRLEQKVHDRKILDGVGGMLHPLDDRLKKLEERPPPKTTLDDAEVQGVLTKQQIQAKTASVAIDRGVERIGTTMSKIDKLTDKVLDLPITNKRIETAVTNALTGEQQETVQALREATMTPDQAVHAVEELNRMSTDLEGGTGVPSPAHPRRISIPGRDFDVPATRVA